MDDDDKELFVSRSSEKTFKNPEMAKKEMRKEKAKSKGKLSDLKRTMLSDQIDDNSLSASEADEETKRIRDVQKEDDKDGTFGTKTHMQMEQDEALSAQTELTPEQIMKMEKDEKTEKRQAGEEYAGDEA